MTINWKVRFKNKVFLASLLALFVSFAYEVMAIMGYVPSVEQSSVMALVDTVLKVLAAVGILVDPTTAGLNDSAQAMTYDKPKE